MKKIFFFTVLLLASTCVNSQISMGGVVRDSSNNLLELATLIALNPKTGSVISYAITDAKGRYKIGLTKNDTFKIKLSYIGMKPLEEVLYTNQQDIKKNYILRTDNDLDEFEVVYEMPVSVQGDTLTYNAESFNKGTERKLEDVLENLPGVEINDDGMVEVEGKVVNKLMINGKDFFDGDTKLATKNVPSKAVDKIQVLRNYSEVGQLRNVRNNQDNIALNIKLKKGKESFWFGTVSAGGGFSSDEALYLAQPKLFYYSPKYSLNFIGDLNNIGEVSLNRRDIRNLSGGFRAPSNSSGTDINLGDNSLKFLTNQNNALEIENRLASGNFSYSPSKSLDLSGFLIYNISQIISKEISLIQYSNPDLNIPNEAREQSSVEKSNQAIMKLSASYQPSLNVQIDYDILGRISDDAQTKNTFSSVTGITHEIDEVTPFSINQNLNYYFTINENNILAFEAQYLIKNEDPLYNVNLANDSDNVYDITAIALGLDNSLSEYNLSQNRRVKSNQLDAKLDYYHILNTKSNINLTLGTILSTQEFNSNLFQSLINGASFNPTLTFNEGRNINDTEYNFRDSYLGAHYRFKKGKFTVTPGFSVHSYGNNNTQFGTTYEDNFLRVLPDFETRIQFKKSEALTIKYNMRNQFTDVTRLAEGLVMNNYNNYQFGESNLQNALSNNVSLFYSSINLFNYTNVFARASYTSNIDQIRGVTNFENVIQTNTFFNSNFADENLNLFGRIQRTFGKLTSEFNTNFNYSKIYQLIQAQQSLNEGYTQAYIPGIRTNYKKAPNIRIRYSYSITANNQGRRKTIFITNSPSISFDAYIKKKITLRSKYTYTNQSLGNGDSQSFQTWDASISYRKDRDAKWEFEVKTTNLLNIDSKVRNSANNLSVFTSETFILPRFVTFRFVYNL